MERGRQKEKASRLEYLGFSFSFSDMKTGFGFAFGLFLFFFSHVYSVTYEKNMKMLWRLLIESCDVRGP